MCRLLDRFAGAFTRKPGELNSRMSQGAKDLLKRAVDDLDTKQLLDYHTHIVGVGAGGTGAFVNPHMRSWRYPFKRIQLAFYLSASKVADIEDADRQYLDRLVDLIRSNEHGGKHYLLAFDQHYNLDGTVNLAKTEFYVPNDYVFALAEQHADIFLPMISVHPYRPDALAELERCAARGARIIKWLPNAMGINPAHEKCEPFYAKMKELGLTLLSHGGEEKAVEAEEDQKLGNPLLLRKPLECGVKVIVAHCAGLGHNSDLESQHPTTQHNFDLFLRLMNEKKYEGLLFADISAMTQYNRVGAPLQTILEREDLHHRLVNGSDYPLPAINILIRTGTLAKHGYLNEAQRQQLNEIYDYNPLLYDYVLKRTLKHPRSARRFPAALFTANALLGI